MIAAMSVILVILIFAVIIAVIVRRSNVIYTDIDDEIVTTHTTVTTTHEAEPIGLNVNGIPVVGILERQWDGSTPFVIDPVDKDKMFLNTKDDLYEDGAGKIWGLK